MTHPRARGWRITLVLVWISMLVGEAAGRDLIFGANARVDNKLFARWLRSVRHYVHPADAEIVVFLPAWNSFTQHIMDEFHAKPVWYNETLLQSRSPLNKMSHLYRYAAYREWIEQHRGEYDRMFLCDTRDVIFQGNPFAEPMRGALHFFLDGRIIGQCRWNSAWVRNCFGDEALAQIERMPISCAGTTVGTEAGMLSYLREMERAIHEAPCEDFGLDQGIHNFFLWTGRFGRPRLWPKDFGAGEAAGRGEPEGAAVFGNGEGYVATLHYTRDFVFDRFGRLVNGAGRPYAVLHQYDRHKAVFEQTVDAAYPYAPEREGLVYTVWYDEGASPGPYPQAAPAGGAGAVASPAQSAPGSGDVLDLDPGPLR
eukprot:tig00001374_g8505.t1